MKEKPIYYIDSCIFIAYINGQHITSNIDKSIDEIFKLFEKNLCILLTSTITKMEVLPYSKNPERDKIFSQFLKRENLRLAEVDIKIIDRARELRSMSASLNEVQTLSTPDAIHISSALHFKATKLFTIDGFKENGNHARMLAFNNLVSSISIEPPSVNQFTETTSEQSEVIF